MTINGGEYQHRFTCALCGNTFYSDPNKDAAMASEFVSRYGHASEETTDDELVSLCDACNDEYEKLRAQQYLDAS